MGGRIVMLSVLIVDDEPNVREGLKNIILWNDYGYEVCGLGKDGDDGLDKIKELNPDLVLIDIKMPGRTGIEVIKEAKQNGFKGKFIIISGYSDFQYTKEAVKYGVKSYILKPIDEDELIEMIITIKNEIDEEAEKEKTRQKGEELIRTHNLKQLILGDDTFVNDKLRAEFNEYKNINVVLLDTHIENKEEYDIDYLREIVKSKLKGLLETEVMEVDNLIIIVYRNIDIRQVMLSLNKIYISLNSLEGISSFIALGKKVKGIDNIADSYKDAKEIMNKKFNYYEYGIVSSEIIDNEIIKNKEFISFSNIYSFVEINDLEKLQQAIKNNEEYIRYQEYTEKRIKSLAIQVYLELKDKVINDYKIKKQNMMINEEVIEAVYSKGTLKETMNWLLNEFKFIAQLICNNSADSSMKRVVKYVEKNYYRDLKLELLAEIFNYNSAYLGKAFKNYTGENFNTYLDKIRIEEAKKYLVNDKLKVYEVCEKVGYKNIDYFHSKFKKYVGTSPLNYKKISKIYN